MDKEAMSNADIIREFFETGRTLRFEADVCSLPGMEEDLKAYLSQHPDVELSGLAACVDLEKSPVLTGLLFDALDQWFGETSRHVSKRIWGYLIRVREYCKEPMIGVSNFRGDAQVEMLRRYLNHVAEDERLTMQWAEHFPREFRYPNYEEAVTIFLRRMLDKGEKLTFTPTPLHAEAANILALCGYEYARTSPTGLFAGFRNYDAFAAFSNVMDAAVRGRCYALPGHARGFTAALTKFFFVGLHATLLEYLLGGDKEFMEVALAALGRIFFDPDQFMYGSEDLTHERSYVKNLVNKVNPGSLRFCGQEWAELQEQAEQCTC